MILILFLSLIPGCTHWGLYKNKEPLRIGLIIGPGGALSLSSLGLIQELQENDIPLSFVMGMGWGALTAAIFAKNESLDEVRWSFHKLLKKGFFKNVKTKNISDLKKELQEIFPNPSQTKIPFVCPSFNHLGLKVWNKGEDPASGLQKCLNTPPFFKSRGGMDRASLFSMREGVHYMKERLKADPIIWLNPLGKSSPQTLLPSQKGASKRLPLLWLELFYALKNEPKMNNVLEAKPDLKNFSLDDFSKIDSIIEAGRQEGRLLVKKLQSLN